MMREHNRFPSLTIIAAALAAASTWSVAQAQSVGVSGQLEPRLSARDPAVEGTAGRIARFVTRSTLGNSSLYYAAGRIGLGTTQPAARLDIRGQNALQIAAPKPRMTFRDMNAANATMVIQSAEGGINLLGDAYLRKTHPHAFLSMDRFGRVGLGTETPLRALQIGPSTDALFTIEPSDTSPRAGVIRFGDGTGWKLHFARSRESSGGPLNTGLTGNLMEIHDDGTFRLVGFPLGPSGVQPLCRTLSNAVTMCASSSSSIRYKAEIRPYHRGLDLIEQLDPIAFKRTATGADDVGFAAEDIADVEPMLTFPDQNGQVDGIKYELLTVVLVNAIKEQQSQLRRQQELIESLESRLARLEAGTR